MGKYFVKKQKTNIRILKLKTTKYKLPRWTLIWYSFIQRYKNGYHNRYVFISLRWWPLMPWRQQSWPPRKDMKRKEKWKWTMYISLYTNGTTGRLRKMIMMILWFHSDSEPLEREREYSQTPVYRTTHELTDRLQDYCKDTQISKYGIFTTKLITRNRASTI